MQKKATFFFLLIKKKTKNIRKNPIQIKKKPMKNNNLHTFVDVSALVNTCIKEEKWAETKQLLETELEKKTDDHWLLTQLSEVFYEMKNYDRALELSTKAFELEPDCPLVMTDHALHLYMHQKDDEAIKIWEKLLTRPIEEIANGECGEGMRNAKSMINDVRARIAISLLAIGEHQKAINYFNEHLNNSFLCGKKKLPQRNERNERKKLCYFIKLYRQFWREVFF